VTFRIDHPRALLRRAGALTAATLVAAVAAAVAPAATGDPQAVDFLNRVAVRYETVPGARVKEKGLFFLHYNGGTSIDYRWGGNRAPGFKPGDAVIDYWLDEGKIVAYLVTVTAKEVPRLRILVIAGNVFVSTSKCWERAGAGSAPFGLGERFLVSDNNGVFEPLRRSGKNTIVTFDYVWLAGTRAKEVATVSSADPPSIHSKIALRGKASLKIDLRITPLRQAPPLPIVTKPPKAPTPAPFCKGKS
jgi:hypothetical protein